MRGALEMSISDTSIGVATISLLAANMNNKILEIVARTSELATKKMVSSTKYKEE